MAAGHGARLQLVFGDRAHRIVRGRARHSSTVGTGASRPDFDGLRAAASPASTRGRPEQRQEGYPENDGQAGWSSSAVESDSTTGASLSRAQLRMARSSTTGAPPGRPTCQMPRHRQCFMLGVEPRELHANLPRRTCPRVRILRPHHSQDPCLFVNATGLRLLPSQMAEDGERQGQRQRQGKRQRQGGQVRVTPWSEIQVVSKGDTDEVP